MPRAPAEIITRSVPLLEKAATDVEGIPDFAAKLREARAISFLFRDKAGLIFGSEDGGGIILARIKNEDGSLGGWTAPSFMHEKGLTVGLQLGFASLGTVMLYLNDAAFHAVSRTNKTFDLGVAADGFGATEHEKESRGTKVRENDYILNTDLDKSAERYHANSDREYASVTFTEEGKIIGAAFNEMGIRVDLETHEKLYGKPYRHHHVLEEGAGKEWAAANAGVQKLVKKLNAIIANGP
mmetsp:Transcript_2009/g.5407  ORF Transcript_2009/g.5407 Transcript_2009/m.5407 type:complete len:240 (+) Transcript_2009:103-822(+)